MKIITIHAKNAIDFLNNNGVGVLTDFSSSPKVKESLNGELYLEFEYISNGKYSKYLIEENIIVSSIGYGERQAFRIEKTKKVINDSNIYIYVFAKHISYDLDDNIIEDSFVQDKDADTALSWILSHTQYEHNFKGSSDIPKRNSARYIFKNPIQAILSDDENSFVNRWGGEIVRDNFNIKMLQARGKDKGVNITYRKNLKGITFETDYSNIATRIKPKGYDGLELPEDEKYVDSLLINNYVNPKITEKEYSDIKLKENAEDEDGFDTLEECYSELRKRAREEFENGIDKPIISATVDFVELSKTIQYEEYKNLEKLCIGDTVHIYIDEFDLEVTEKVISTEYDPVLEKYTSFELGKPFSSYTLENKKFEKKLEETIIPSYMDVAIQNATNLLTTALGGFIVKTRNELFILDNEDINKAKKIWRWNINGLGYSKNGIKGPYETAITQDGQIVADFITAGTMSVNRIEGLSNTLKEFTKIILEHNKISMLVSNTIDITKEVNEKTNCLELTNCMKGKLIEFEIFGDNNVFGECELDQNTELDQSSIFYKRNTTLKINETNLKENIKYVTGNLDIINHQYNTGLQKCKSIILPITGNRTYTVSKNSGNRFALGTFNEEPAPGIIATNYISDKNEGKNLTELEITSSESDKYLVVFFYDGNLDTNLETMYNSIKIYSGYKKIDLDFQGALNAVTIKNILEDGTIEEKIICDSLLLKNDTLFLIRRVGIDTLGKVHVLEKENVIPLMNLIIYLEEGINTIGIDDCYCTEMRAKYVITNEYTKIFSTKVEMNASIEMLENRMKFMVTQNNVLASLNLAIENGQGIVAFKSNQFTVDSDFLTIDKYGRVTATAGKFGGWNLTKYYLYANYNIDGKTYQCGLYSNVTNGNDVFLYAGAPINSDGSFENVSNWNMYITKNGKVKAKWFEVNRRKWLFQYKL